MRKLLAVIISACLLALVLAVPASAAPMDPPNSCGQVHSTYDKSTNGPLGQMLSAEVHEINAGQTAFKNWGRATQYVMDQYR